MTWPAHGCPSATGHSLPRPRDLAASAWTRLAAADQVRLFTPTRLITNRLPRLRASPSGHARSALHCQELLHFCIRL
jgi:hypothetical protein